MSALAIVAAFILVALLVFFAAMRTGPGRSAVRKRGGADSESRRSTRKVLLAAGLIAVLFGIAIPVWAFIYNNDDQAAAARGGVDLSARQEHGRELFEYHCATCHTLVDAGAYGKVGPDLDQLRPNAALTLDAVAKGRARGQGQMPAGLVEGDDARALAEYVQAVAGR